MCIRDRNISDEDLAKVREEVADILLYIIRLSDKLDIDLVWYTQWDKTMKSEAAKLELNL